MIGKTNAQTVGSVNGKTGVVVIDKTDLELDNVKNVDTTNASNIDSGTLGSDRLPVVPITKGGTGATTAAGARSSLGINPAQIGAISITQKGAANGVAELDSNNKVPLSQINDSLIGQVEYKGSWNASTNTPTLPSTPTEKGIYYVTSVGGTQFGLTFEVGDWIISNGTTWQKVDNTDAVSSVAGKTGVVVLDKTDVGLGNVDNTSDVNKPVSAATQTALDGKVDKVTGKGLSTNDYTNDEKAKLAGLDENAAKTNEFNNFTHKQTFDAGVEITGHTIINSSYLMCNNIDAKGQVSIIDANELGAVTLLPQPGIANVNRTVTIPFKNGTLALTSDIPTTPSDIGAAEPPLISNNVSVSTWTADTTYTGYGYKADIAITGVTANDFAEVVFAPTEALSGNYAPIIATDTNKVTIYAKVNTAITIPTIWVQRRV